MKKITLYVISCSEMINNIHFMDPRRNQTVWSRDAVSLIWFYLDRVPAWLLRASGLGNLTSFFLHKNWILFQISRIKAKRLSTFISKFQSAFIQWYIDTMIHWYTDMLIQCYIDTIDTMIPWYNWYCCLDVAKLTVHEDYASLKVRLNKITRQSTLAR